MAMFLGTNPRTGEGRKDQGPQAVVRFADVSFGARAIPPCVQSQRTGGHIENLREGAFAHSRNHIRRFHRSVFFAEFFKRPLVVEETGQRRNSLPYGGRIYRIRPSFRLLVAPDMILTTSGCRF